MLAFYGLFFTLIELFLISFHMKKILTFLAFTSLSTISAFAASGTDTMSLSNLVNTTTSSSWTTPKATVVPLLLDTVKVDDASTISLKFNQGIVVDSVRVRIINQATNESVKVASITGSLDSLSTAVIKSESPLVLGDSYVLTIIAVTSTTDVNIRSGVDSIREFTVPREFKTIDLSAPPNPTAVVVADTGSTTTGSMQTGVVVETATASVTPSVVAPAMTGSTDVKKNVTPDALPQTGIETTLLIIIAAAAASVLLLRRKRV